MLCPQQLVHKLTSIVRIAVALDRKNAGAVKGVAVLTEPEECVFIVHPAIVDGVVQDVSLEIWSARQELDYFCKTHGLDKASIVEGDPVESAS